ncbi:hypothetical protein GALMADRAFT_160830 [Galerina marginata CBS 339.88]|uniref:Uncharacterized protein n=1 Tax=Galerina marginata (strain CBS 339.88) TaxID=685588 RepID=A0A067SFI2_GALM3|nr:hypothetical protein GALMADRAFT_160830 [Galerina marginata CBS 339.88]
MIFTRIVAALFATAVCAQALYIPDVLYARDFEDSRDLTARELSERGLHHFNAIRDLAENNDVLALASRDLTTLELRSGEVLSHPIVARTESRSPSPGPYGCNTKADCQKKIDYAKYQEKESKKKVDHWKKALKDAGSDEAKKRTAKNNLDTARGSYEHWTEEVEAYTNMKATMKS